MKTQSGIPFKNHPLLLLLAIATGTFPASSSFSAGVYTHWTAYGATTATGRLGSSAVTLTTDIAAYGSNFSSPVVGANILGTFPGYGTNYFTPDIPLADTVGLASGSSFTLTFQPPVTNPTLQIYQLADNTWSFSDGANPVSFQLVSSDGTFTLPTGSTSATLTGTQSATDSSGSLFFTGTFSRISWHSDDNRPEDGVDLQISIPYSVLTILPTNNGVVLLWPAGAPAFRLQQTADLTANNWVSNTSPVNVVNGTNQVTFSPAAGNLFFRLISP